MSPKSLCEKSRKMARSHSDNHLCYSINRIRMIRACATQPKLKTSRSFKNFKVQLPDSIIPRSLRSFLFDPETSKSMSITKLEDDLEKTDKDTKENDEYVISEANWVERLVEVRTRWRDGRKNENVGGGYDGDSDQVCADEGGCEVEYEDKEEETESSTIDRESFSNLLAEVSWSDAKNFAQLAFLCNMAYAIPGIKANDLKRLYGLDFVTSSLEKKAEANSLDGKLDDESNDKNALSPKEKIFNRNAAYEIAALAASYVHSRAKEFLTLRSELKQDDKNSDGDNKSIDIEDGEECFLSRVYNSEVAAHVAASTMTVVVAAGETEKQKTAKDLQSLHSSPCEWFICDDRSTYTRCFVIQGSYSLASWQANLFFEPTKFEDSEALVHRGIYEAAKGIFAQFMPQITEHINKYGERAKFQFTGHSLGGSLALLVYLMLLTRKVVNPSALRHVTTFGSPFVFCGGQKVLHELGVNEDSVHCVMMHRDIVPRAFACNYPNHVAQILKRLSGSFRNHPCLNKKKLMYSPMGKIFILQPDQKSSPPHPFLPPGIALYALTNTKITPHQFLKNAIRAFLNSPHPLETLSDPTAYTSEGTIKRDHDSSNYLKAINAVIRQERVKNAVKRAKRGRKNVKWPLLTSQSPHAWGHDIDLEAMRLVNKEVMTSV